MPNETRLERRLRTIFEQGRDYIQHEDDLVDRRLKWVITISGFLFAAYGGSLIASANGAIDSAEKLLISGARIGMGLTGVISCLIGANSINAAHMAIKAINRKYTAFVLANEAGIKAEKLHVWQLIGDRPNKIPGFTSSLLQPYLIALVWCALVLLELALASQNADILSEIQKISSDDVRILGQMVVAFVLFFIACGWMVGTTIQKLRAAGSGEDGFVSRDKINKRVKAFKKISDASFGRDLNAPDAQPLKPEED